MRGTRAKKLRKLATAHPSTVQAGYYGSTLIHGGIRRAYKNLKRWWRGY